MFRNFFGTILPGMLAAVALFAAMPDKAEAGGIDPFVGEILYVGFNFAPKDWAKCDGQILQVMNNQTLYSLLGDRFGGNGRSTFGLPDMRGRVPIHQGKGPSLSNYVMGGRGGQERYQLKVDNLAAHSHNSSATSNSTSTVSGSVGAATLNAYNGGGNKATAAGNSLANITGLAVGKGAYNSNAPNVKMKAGSVSVDISGIRVATNTTTTVIINNTGKDQSFPVMQPYTVLNCIISLNGIYPSRQ